MNQYENIQLFNNNFKMLRLAIIGVSGRNQIDKKKLCAEHMNWMKCCVRQYINDILKKKTNEIILVSGGSAWVDHVAVQLFLTGEFGGLELYLPSEFDIKLKKYVNTHEGITLNSLHAECQEKTGINVFVELARAINNETTKVTIQKGFLTRNTLIAKNCDHLIAFTFNSNALTGGTFDTWKKTAHQNKIIFDLNDLYKISF